MKTQPNDPVQALNAQELRTNNYVYADIGLPSLDLHTIKSADFVGIEKGEHWVYAVPLTEEWLVRFGFKETYRSVYQIKYDLSGQEQFGYDFGLVGGINGMRRLRYYGRYIKCEHVHRMQNIIHALTGQELTYNPK